MVIKCDFVAKKIKGLLAGINSLLIAFVVYKTFFGTFVVKIYLQASIDRNVMFFNDFYFM